MAWEISHGPEAWGNAYMNLQNKPAEWLAEACATVAADRQQELDNAFWDACWRRDVDDENINNVPDWQWSYNRALDRLHDCPHHVLVDHAMQCIEINNTCDNGGFNFYIDNGGFYTVSVDYERGIAL